MFQGVWGLMLFSLIEIAKLLVLNVRLGGFKLLGFRVSNTAGLA